MSARSCNESLDEVTRRTTPEFIWHFRGQGSTARGGYGVLRIPNALTRLECSQVLQLAACLPIAPGLTEAPVAGIRRSLVRWISPSGTTGWMFERVESLFRRAQTELGFDVDGLSEPLQLATYPERGHFDWHTDLAADPVFERKLSLTIQLTDADSYEGGDLDFFPLGSVPRCRPQGTAIVFPSFLPHRVGDVTRGMRNALVAWAGGRPLR